ncbi:Guanylate kinase [Caldithrix abyssi DSM 13497]|uniref:Guanylate kinase n=1 Tax=Caldithrix abyssi DSM 13497 TaxID=880073 RepID=H1XWX6_CALAY|nr:guanylate kinase [Caldithrix abyssi]APF19529.1 gmk guanylate kinase [Caldithrix abyssi DSM 13497]EHO39663.1 Guanylate kinase [Caldithrix abyssi DSM 13497]
MKFKSPYIVFSAPSGGGKTTIVKTLNARHPETVISVSATTRPIRPNEKDGVDYYFLDKETFEKYIEQGKFLEYEQVHGNYYGTLKEVVERHTAEGKTVLFDIDVNGALSIKKHYPQAILIFLKPPSEQVLIERLKKRKTETEETIRKRLARLPYEYQQAEKFDYIVINDDLEKTIKEIETIILAEK